MLRKVLQPAVVAAVLLSCNQLNTYAQADEVHTIELVEHSISQDSAMLPPLFKLSQQVTLPHNAIAIPTASAWYKFSFDLDHAPEKSLSLFLPLINMNASVYLNQKLVGASGSFDEPMSRFWHTPVLFYLPMGNLAQGENTVHIRLKASPPNDLTQMGKIYWGDIQPIYEMYASEYFFSYTIHLMALSAALFLGFIVFYLWLIRRLPEYLYFSLASLTWAISSLNVVIHNQPFSTHTWEWLIHTNLSLMPVFIMLFVRRVMGLANNGFERSVWGVTILFALALSIMPDMYFFPLANTWHFLTLFLAIYTVYLVISHYLKHRERTMLTLSLGFFLVASFGIHDYLIIVGVLDAESRFLMDYSMPLLLIAIAVVLIQRFVEASTGLEHANATLEQRVQEAEAKIKDSYQTIAELEASKAVDKERSRIFGDLHDDLGAKLLSLVYKSETDEQKKLARQAMDGLREIVKRSPADIPSHRQSNTIAEWLSECQTRCAEQHIPFEWHQQHIPHDFKPPEGMTNVLREAISNAIKHGDKKRICVRMQIRFARLMISVCNTGNAFSNQSEQGSGRKIMQHRVNNLHGKIRWRSGGHGGCHVAWAVPLQGGLND
jgi:signal transduction histidine kinase